MLDCNTFARCIQSRKTFAIGSVSTVLFMSIAQDAEQGIQPERRLRRLVFSISSGRRRVNLVVQHEAVHSQHELPLLPFDLPERYWGYVSRRGCLRLVRQHTFRPDRPKTQRLATSMREQSFSCQNP